MNKITILIEFIDEIKAQLAIEKGVFNYFAENEAITEIKTRGNIVEVTIQYCSCVTTEYENIIFAIAEELAYNFEYFIFNGSFSSATKEDFFLGKLQNKVMTLAHHYFTNETKFINCPHCAKKVIDLTTYLYGEKFLCPACGFSIADILAAKYEINNSHCVTSLSNVVIYDVIDGESEAVQSLYLRK